MILQTKIIVNIILLVFCINGMSNAQNFIHGKIERDTRWKGDIYIDGDVTVPRGVILSIEAGSKIFIKPNTDVLSSGIDREKTEIVVDGVLLIRGGRNEQRVVITSASKSPQMNDWYGIILKNLYESSRINYAKIEFAYKGITCYGSAPFIIHTIIQYNHNAGISCEVRAKPEIKTCLISGNGFAGINCELASTPIISDSEISQNAYGVLILTKSKPDLGRISARAGGSEGKNSIMNNFDYDIYNHSIHDIYAQNNRWTSNASSEIRFKIFDNRDNSAYGKVFFEPRYGAGYQQSEPQFPNSDSAAGQGNRALAQQLAEKSLLEKPLTESKQPDSAEKSAPQKDPFATLKKSQDADTLYSYKISGQRSPVTPKINLREPILEAQLDAGRREYLNREKPVYPGIYLKTGTTGTVIIEVVVTRSGDIESYKVLKSDAELFTSAAIQALKKFRYKPGTYRGFKVRYKIVELFRFEKD